MSNSFYRMLNIDGTINHFTGFCLIIIYSTGSLVSYCVPEALGSFLKSIGRAMERSLFRDTPLDPGDSALCLH